MKSESTVTIWLVKITVQSLQIRDFTWVSNLQTQKTFCKGIPIFSDVILWQKIPQNNINNCSYQTSARIKQILPGRVFWPRNISTSIYSVGTTIIKIEDILKSVNVIITWCVLSNEFKSKEKVKLLKHFKTMYVMGLHKSSLRKS